jgi:MSHA biogenesis protein MshI
MFALKTGKQPTLLSSVVPCPAGIAIAQVEQQNEASFALQSCEFIPVPAGGDTDIAQLLKGHRLDKQPCTTMLPIGDYQLLVVDAPEVPPAELRAAIRWRIQDMIDFHVDDAVLDVFDVTVSSSNYTKKQLYVVVARTSTVKQHINQLEQAGVNLDIIDIPELALRNIAARLPEDASGLVTLYFEEERCLITLTHESRLYLTRTLDIGYRQLQEAASNPQPLSNRLALEIQRSMDYYEHNYRQAPIKSLAILPVPVTLYGFTDALQQTLGLETRIVSMSDILECGPEPDAETTARCLLAVGSALRTEEKTL